MAVEIFLELDDVEGESLKSGFEGKIDILQYSWSSTQSATRHSGTGGGSGQANVGDIHFSKYLDKSTPVLYKYLLHGKHFDYMLSNPPFGVEWKKIEKEIRKEAEQMGHNGRFGPGLPRVSDGSLLFLLHLISKMRPAVDGGSRFGIVLNGSPLFTGGAGSGESEIRRYVLENDLVEAIIGLPTDMFYNTGISTYVWIVSNRKPKARKGKLQLIDASGFWQKMRKSLGSKRKELSPAHIEDITRLFGKFKESTRDGVPISRIFKNTDFGYRTITVERPLRDAKGKILLGEKGKLKGKPQPDSSLRDTENVPLAEDVETYFKREVLPHAPDAWIDHEKTKVGYEIPFNRHFYVFTPPRPLAEIDAAVPRRDAVAAHLHERNGDLTLAAELYASAARNAPNLAERDHQTRQAARVNQLLRGGDTPSPPP